MRVGADEGVRIDRLLAAVVLHKGNSGKVLQIDLVDNAGVGWNRAEVLKRSLAPLKELVALVVTLKLEVPVDQQRSFGAELVDLDRVVDYQLNRLKWIDLFWIATKLGDRIAHRGKVYDARNSGEVLQENAGRSKGDLLIGLLLGVPIRQCFNLFGKSALTVFRAQEILKENPQRIREFGDIRALVLESVKPVDLISLPSEYELGTGVE